MLYERERELDVIAAALGEAADDRGSAVIVEGPAGIGKTALLDIARDMARVRGMAVALARGSDLEVAYAWGLVGQLFEPRLRSLSGAERAQTLAGASALAGPVILRDGPVEADPSFGVLHGLYWLVATLAAQQPLLLVVDDLQWADGASLRFLEFLALRIETVPAVLLVARRPGGHDLRAVPVMTLGALSPAATAVVLGEYIPFTASELAARFHALTGGNPLLVQRLAVAVRDGGITDADGLERLGADAVAGPIRAALSRLGDGAFRLAGAIAVLERAPLTTTADLAGLRSREADELAAQLVRAGILRDAHPVEFAHPLVREAVLGILMSSERQRLHARAASLLAARGAVPEAIAAQLLHTGPRGDAEVAATLADAGRRALASGALDEATACLARGLEEPPPTRERAALLLDLARAENGLGRPGVLDRVREAFATAPDAQGRAHAALALGWAVGSGLRDQQEALPMIEEAIAGVTGHDRELELRLQALRLFAHSLGTTLERTSLSEAETFSTLAGRTVGECELLLQVAVNRALAQRSAAEVAEPLERAVADPGVVAAIGPESAWLNFVLALLLRADRLDAMRRTLAVGAAEAQRRGAARPFATVLVWRAWLGLREGSARDAEADARGAYEAFPTRPWRYVFGASCLIEVLVERGEIQEAQAVLEASGYARDAPLDRSAEWMLFARSILRTAQGDLDGALADQLELRRRRGGSGPDWDRMRTARLMYATGDLDAAAREAKAALAWARVWDTSAAVGEALTVWGLVAGGDEGLTALRDGIAQLETSPARRVLTQALIDFGAALRRRGERRAAREPLRRALDLAVAGGLEATARRAREELQVTGARIRRDAATGLAALTPSERRIVELAAGGATNPEIAQALFVTAKTVEMHLGNAYRKLDISSRRDLAALLSS